MSKGCQTKDYELLSKLSKLWLTRDDKIYKEPLSKLMKVINPDQVSGLPVLVKEADLINMQVRWL